MSLFKKIAAVGAVAIGLVVSSSAFAATFTGTIYERHDYYGNDYTTVGYHNVYIGSSGLYSFDILSRGVLGGNASGYGYRSGLDSVVRLFTYNSSYSNNLGYSVANNDDGYSAGYGDGSISSRDSFLRTYLNPGWYVAAVGDYFFTNTDARNGYNYGGMPGTYARYQLTVSEVPLPAAMPMLLAGLGGLAFMRRRKNKA